MYVVLVVASDTDKRKHEIQQYLENATSAAAAAAAAAVADGGPKTRSGARDPTARDETTRVPEGGRSVSCADVIGGWEIGKSRAPK